MLLSPDMIATREQAGTSSYGTPIVYILSKGGLNCFFTKDGSGSVITLGTAPHKAIAAWLSEKRDPKLKWNSEFVQKSEVTVDDIQKSDNARFQSLRSVIFYPKNADQLEKSENDDGFLVYDIDEVRIGVFSKAEIIEAIEKNEVSRYAVVRDLGLTTSPSVLELHPAFAQTYQRIKDAN